MDQERTGLHHPVTALQGGRLEPYDHAHLRARFGAGQVAEAWRVGQRVPVLRDADRTDRVRHHPVVGTHGQHPLPGRADPDARHARERQRWILRQAALQGRAAVQAYRHGGVGARDDGPVGAEPHRGAPARGQGEEGPPMRRTPMASKSPGRKYPALMAATALPAHSPTVRPSPLRPTTRSSVATGSNDRTWTRVSPCRPVARIDRYDTPGATRRVASAGSSGATGGASRAGSACAGAAGAPASSPARPA